MLGFIFGLLILSSCLSYASTTVFDYSSSVIGFEIKYKSCFFFPRCFCFFQSLTYGFQDQILSFCQKLAGIFIESVFNLSFQWCLEFSGPRLHFFQKFIPKYLILCDAILQGSVFKNFILPLFIISSLLVCGRNIVEFWMNFLISSFSGNLFKFLGFGSATYQVYEFWQFLTVMHLSVLLCIMGQ